MPELLHQTNIEKISANIIDGMRDPIQNASRNLDSDSGESVVLAIIRTIPTLGTPPSLVVAARLDPARLLDILQAQ